MNLTITGMASAKDQTARIIRGVANMERTTALVGSRIPYAYGIEVGVDRNGKLRRRAGGSHALERARSEVLSQADRDIGEGLSRVTAPGAWVIMRVAKWVRRLARKYEVVGEEREILRKSGKISIHKRGTLRKSIHIERVIG